MASLSLADAPLPLSDPMNNGRWQLNESVSDEFEGQDLDLQKWNNLGRGGNDFGQWKGRAPSQYNPENVRVENGNLFIVSKWDPTFTFSSAKCNNGLAYGKPAPVTTAAIMSTASFKYGYMEMRCKAADGPVSSSFWSTGNGGEIDVFEHFGDDRKDGYAARRYHTSFHDWRKESPMFGKRIWTNSHQLGFRVADDFHVYGLHWDPNFVAIYVDGRLIGLHNKKTIGDKWVASNEQRIWIDSETFDWEVPPGELSASDFGDGREFIVDYCRIWQSDEAGEPITLGTNLLANSSFESGADSWEGAAVVTDDSHWGQHAAKMETGGMIEQVVDVKPNSTYVLSAWVKSPQTNEKDKWFSAFLGAKNFGNPEANVKFFFPGYHYKSIEFTTGQTASQATVYFTNRPHGGLAVIDDVLLVESKEAPPNGRSSQREPDKTNLPNIRLARIDGRHWLIGSDGKPFFAHGITHVGNARSKHDFMDVAAACKRLGFNAYGYGCPPELRFDMPYLESWNDLVPISMYRSKGVGGKGDSSEGAHKFVDIFDPREQARIEAGVKANCEQSKNNPNCIGYCWTDLATWPLENHAKKNWVDFTRSLPQDAPGQKAYQTFLSTWDGDDDKSRDQAFLRLIAREYFRVIGEANRKYDPDHIIFGDRLSFYTYDADVLKEMLPWVDAIAFQPHFWGPFPKKELDAIYELSGKPILLCDFAIRFRDGDKDVTNWKLYKDSVAAGEAYVEYVKAAMATKYILGVFWCNPIDSSKGFGETGVKHGFFGDGLSERPGLHEAVRKRNAYRDNITPGSSTR